jgi:hypothetical protein
MWLWTSFAYFRSYGLDFIFRHHEHLSCFFITQRWFIAGITGRPQRWWVLWWWRLRRRLWRVLNLFELISN